MAATSVSGDAGVAASACVGDENSKIEEGDG